VSVNLAEFISGFLAEASDHLRSINSNLLLVDDAIKAQTSNPRAVRELFRSLHTLKGLAGMVGVEPLVDITHAMERVLRDAEQAGGRLPAQAFEPLLQGTQAIAQRVAALAAGKNVANAPKELLSRLDLLDASEVNSTHNPRRLKLNPSLLAKLNASEMEQLSGASGARRALQMLFTPSAERAAQGITITSVRERLVQHAEIVKVVPVTASGQGGLSFLLLVISSASLGELASLVESSPEEVVELVEREGGTAPLEVFEADSDGPTTANVLRVEVRRVDAAMDGLGELLVNRFRLVRAIADLKAKGVDVRELEEVAQDTERRLKEVRTRVLGLRMISLSELLERLPILVRGLQATTGKNAQVQLDVGKAEVDKAVGERIWPALVHLVRNAMDHGLETEAERIKLGKPAHGIIRVSCLRTSDSRVQLIIEDDGKGVDAERAAQRAGSPVPTDADALLELIARPGLSTRTTATSTSGRGMGLDIARRTVTDELGGELHMQTQLGVGTRFVLEVPVTVAVVDAFRCRTQSQSFLVPVSSIEEFVEVDPLQLVEGPRLGSTSAVRTAMYSRRGRTMPFVELSALVGETAAMRSKKAMIVRRNEQLFAFGVEQLLGQHEIIVRPLTDPLVRVPGVAGTADLGDGRPTLLLDLIALCRLCEPLERAA
jgi:two-component system, chemotaxis family, sensor kinase CheA